MRPTRLELEGFTAFRERTVVDFTDAELFVLFGPTGAGKSSLIDAIGFALYGQVTRYDDKRVVHPVITQGAAEARVRLDFEHGGRPYTAVRVVRRTKGGASTREARLESDAEVLAANVNELDRAVAELFGLNFDQFTTCVVLPQGEFARFLHAPPGERQDLLRSLLRLELYEQVGRRAREHARREHERILVLEHQIEELAPPSTQAVAGARRRARALEDLAAEVEEHRKQLAELEQRRREAAERAVASERAAAELARVRRPAEITTLAATRREARARLASSQDRLEALRRARDEARRAREPLGDAGGLRALLASYEDLAHAREEAARAAGELRRQDAALRRAVEVLAEARTALEAATREHEALADEHRAYLLARGLEAGCPCPVCLRVVEHPPRHPEPPALTEVEQRVAQARTEFESATAAEQRARVHRARAEEAARLAAERAAHLERRLAGAPEVDQLREDLEHITALDTRIEEALAAEREAEAERAAAQRELDRVAGEEERAWRKFRSLREQLAARVGEPPRTEPDELEQAWSRLVDWARDRERREEENAARAREEERAAAAAIAASRHELERRAAALELPFHDRDPVHAVAEALAEARAALRDYERRRERAAELQTLLRKAKERHTVAKALGEHIHRDRFQTWLTSEALAALTAGASERLLELTGEAYSFALRDNFELGVVDHRNADEIRSVRTLSGGESFLASLALALSLADHVAALAPSGAAPLESLFLDEGFGALDSETLDTVAATLQELGARGRMVGIVTHVRELAEQLPVRYRVAKGPRTATVERLAP